MKMQNFRLILQIAAVLAMTFWWGGLTFYSLVAVPIGVDVLGGATEQGFITRLVTGWINLAGAATLCILLGSMWAIWKSLGKPARAVLTATWLVMALAQLILLVVHPQLDAMLDPQTQGIDDPTKFHALHEFYLTVTGIQWFAGLAHLLILLLNWTS